MWLTDERVHVICEELKRLITVECSPAGRIFYKEGLFFTPGEADNDGENWKEFLPEKMKWYGPDRHYWFRTDFTIPEKYAGKRLELFVKTNHARQEVGV